MKVVVLSIFWLAMINLIHKDMALSGKVARSLFWATIHIFFNLRLYGFAFVSNKLVVEMGFVDFLEFNNLNPILFCIPNSELACMEAFGCENYLRPYGGHAIYHAMIPLTTIA